MIYYKHCAVMRGTRRIHLYSQTLLAVNGIIALEDAPAPHVKIALGMRGYRLMKSPPPKPSEAPESPAPGPQAPETAPAEGPASPTEAPETPAEGKEDTGTPAKDEKPQKPPARKAKKSDRKG